MNYRSIAVPVQAEQVIYSEVSTIEGELFNKYCIDTRIHGGWPMLRPHFGGTIIESGDWLVEFPNGEVHVVRDIRFKQRFEHVESYTKEDIKSAVSMARKLAEMGGEFS